MGVFAQLRQMMLDAQYLDAYRALNGREAGFTFPAWDPHVRLDYVFVPATAAERLKACRVVEVGAALATASDHFPLLAELDLGTNGGG